MKFTRTRLCSLLAASLAGLLPVRAAPATNGVTLARLCSWEIVVAPDAIPSERYAAEELRRVLAEATGCTLPIRDRASTASGHIAIGPGVAASAMGEGVGQGACGPEDLRIAVREDGLVITGGRPRGTLYGVYTFLEDQLGVRFLTAAHTHIPAWKPDRVLPCGEWSYHPPLEFRRSYYAENEQDEFFAARLRQHSERMGAAQVGGPVPFRLINHSFALRLPTAKYGAGHPEYYGLVDNRRRNLVREDWGGHGNQPCLSNAEVLRIVTDDVLAELAAHPERRNVSVSQNDNGYYCRCPACAARDARAGSPMGALLAFVNSVADRVAQTHPDVWVGTLAYDYSQPPPRGLAPRPNVQIQLCSIACCLTHPLEADGCPQGAAFRHDFAGWGRLCDKLTIWSYNVNFADYLLPCPDLRTIAPNIRYFAAHGARGIMMQGAYNGAGAELSELRNYVTSRLLWNPALDGQALTDEFLDLHYRSAAPPIRRFLGLVHDRAAGQALHRACSGTAADFGIDEVVAGAGLAAFAKALELADDGAVRARVEQASICAYRAALEPAWRVRLPGLFPEARRRELQPLAQRFFDLCHRYGVTMAGEHESLDDVRARLAFLLRADPVP